LRATLRAAVATIAALAAMMAVATTAVSGTAATIEASASTPSAIGTSTAITTAITAASAIPAAAAAAERPLKAGARAAADTGRVARLKFFARRAAGTRGARFAGEKNFVFCRAGCGGLRGFAFELALALFAVLIVLFVRRLVVFEFDVVTERGDVQRVFMRGIGFSFRDGLPTAYALLAFGFVFAGLAFLVVFFRFFVFVVFRPFFVGFFLFFFEHRAGDDAVDLRDFNNFILLRVDQAGGKRGAFVITEFRAVAILRFVGSRLGVLHCFDFFVVEFGDVLCFSLRLFVDDFRGFRTGSCEEPAGKGTTGAARTGS
jgi:hypothetical protein